jgi:hypothetical protein
VTGKIDSALVEAVCRPHCRFFKPGAKEELSCGGYDFLAAKMSEAMKKPGRETPPASCAHDPRIEKKICAACPFRQNDCDFMSASPPPGSVPCGGYVLILRLLAAGSREAEEWLHD